MILRARNAVLVVSMLAVTAVTAAAPAVADPDPGVQISGRVTETGTGSPLENVKVCAEEVAPGEGEACVTTDAEGDYGISGLPAGTYLVAFGVEVPSSGERTVAQWWDGASSPEAATPLAVVAPQIFTGIDGQVGKSPPPPEPASGGGTIIVPGPEATAPPELSPLRCKKGYRWQKIGGVKRCVPKPKHHHKRRHRHHH
jgi:Carboxypeptidase regulatory-like domain